MPVTLVPEITFLGIIRAFFSLFSILFSSANSDLILLPSSSISNDSSSLFVEKPLVPGEADCRCSDSAIGMLSGSFFSGSKVPLFSEEVEATCEEELDLVDGCLELDDGKLS